MKMPKISVVLPCYNVEPYIGKCLDSLLAQTLSDIEIICVDDKSTDNTVSVINEYMARDKRIKLFSQPKNMGAGPARNMGIKNATGKYIAFLDPDDFYAENASLEKLYNAAESNDVNICGGNLIELGQDGVLRESPVMPFFKSYGLLNFAVNSFSYGFYRFIYKRDFLLRNNIWFPDYLRYQDPPFLVKAMAISGQYYVIPDIINIYRIGHKSVNWTERRVYDTFCGIRDVLKITREYNLSNLHMDMVINHLFHSSYHEVYQHQAHIEKIQNVLKECFILIDWSLAQKCKANKLPCFELYVQVAKADKNLWKQMKGFIEKDFYLFRKERCPNGRRHIYFCGVKILSYKRHRTVRIPALKKCKYVHIMHNDKFIAPFVEFMNRHFNMDEHLFLCMHTCPQFPFPTGKNVVKIRDLRGIKLNRANIKQVICHSLFIPGLVDYLYQHQDILTHKAYWCIWGGDLYNAPRDAVNDFVRKNFYAYIGLMDREYALNKYGMRDNFYGANYIFPTLFGNDDVVIQKSEHPIRIQINNSADDSTLEILDILSKFRDQDIEIYTILSYGKMEYRDQIIARGTELFGDKFHYLDKYLEPDEYKEFVKQNHILILNQNRQQGVGNTILNIQYGNKVFIRGDVSTYKYLNDVDGVKIFDSRKIGDMTFDEFIANDYVEQNRKNIRNRTDESVIAQRWGNIFNAD